MLCWWLSDQGGVNLLRSLTADVAPQRFRSGAGIPITMLERFDSTATPLWIAMLHYRVLGEGAGISAEDDERIRQYSYTVMKRDLCCTAGSQTRVLALLQTHFPGLALWRLHHGSCLCCIAGSQSRVEALLQNFDLVYDT